MQSVYQRVDQILYVLLAEGAQLIDSPNHHEQCLLAYEYPEATSRYFIQVADIGPGHAVILNEPDGETQVLVDPLAKEHGVTIFLYADNISEQELTHDFKEFLGGQFNKQLRQSMRECQTSVVVVSRRIEQR